MKALVYTGPRALDYRDVPAPEPGGDALIAVAHVGICGSDMHAYAGHDERRPAPLILGHEAAGRVIAGPGEGTRVTINPLVTCGECEACRAERDNLCPDRQIISMPPREGAFAERLAMPARNLLAIPDHVPSEKAALAEPLACGWHAVRLAEEVLDRPLGQARCRVLGSGAIGLGAALVLAARGGQRKRTPRRRDRSYRAWRVLGRAGHPADDASGDHLHRHLYLYRAGFPRHGNGNVRRSARAARLARGQAAFRGGARLRRLARGPGGRPEDHAGTLVMQLRQTFRLVMQAVTLRRSSGSRTMLGMVG
ncbi:MAG: zinc-dependent alcohol dehydrogenase [Dichotomicrobium sp.]